MYKNITLVAFISAFTLTACGGGGSTTVPTSNGSSKSALSSVSSSKSSVISSSSSSSSSSAKASSIASSVSSASAPGENVSSSSVVASSSSVARSSSSSVVAPVSSSSVASSSVKSSSSSVKSSSSSVVSSSSSSVAKSSSSSSVAVSSSSSVASSSSSVSSGPASIYHVRGSFNEWKEGTLMSPTGVANVYELCVNFLAGDEANGGPRFKIDPEGGWGADAVPSADYTVTAGWVKITFNSLSKAITTQQNLPAYCPGASSSSSSVASSSVKSSSSSSVAPSSSSVASSSAKSSSSSSVAPSSSSSSTAPSSSSSSAASSSSLGPHYAGEDCQTCHKVGGTAEKKIFTIAGTVYTARTAAGVVNPAATIVIMDNQKLNEIIKVQTDANGNFYSYKSLDGRAIQDVHPKAIGATTMKEMGSTQPTTGSCNFCHNGKAVEDYETFRLYIN